MNHIQRIATEIERSAINAALTMLADSIDDGNEHNFPEMSADEIRALAERFKHHDL